MKKTCSDQEFIELFESIGGQALADKSGVSVRGVMKRRANLERAVGRQITAPEGNFRTRFSIEHPQRVPLSIDNGHVLVGSDAHYWPNTVTTAHRAFVRACKEYQPKAIIMNGDVFDGASVSRHPSIGWENKPTVIQEIETCQARLTEIQDAAPNAERVWTLGNHDGRFESRLANVAPEYAKVHGVHLKDHFPYWSPCWSCWINPDTFGAPVIKHRFKNGTHATHTGAMWAGRSIVTGHLHSLKVTPFTDYNGTRFGVDTGTLAEPNGPQFVDYTEDNPKNHRSGFIVLTFHKGKLLWPEIAHIIEKDTVEFRGRVYNV